MDFADSVTVQWFTAEEQTLVTTIWQAMFGVAGIVSNLMAYGFYHVKGRHPLWSWQWLNVSVAIISFIAAAIVLALLPDTPPQARWASAEDKVLFVERVRKNDQGIKQKKYQGEQLREALTDPVSWLLFFMIFFQTLVVGGLNTFNSLLIKNAFGFSVRYNPTSTNTRHWTHSSSASRCRYSRSDCTFSSGE